MAAPPQYTYQPQPNELPYYNVLFTTADKSSSGHLSGAVAVEFLSLSKLPVDLLKQIWTMADQPPSNTLDMSKFYVAVRLIQLFQNGKKPIDLALNIADGESNPMRPPFFEGVNVQAIMQQQQQQQQQQQGGGASVAPRPPMQQQLSSQNLGAPQQLQQPTPQGSPQRSPQLNGMSAQQPPAMSQPAMNSAPTNNQQQQQQLAIQDPYTMTPQELSRYEQLFPTYAVQEADGMFVHGAAAVELFSKSGMPNEQLKAIWSMSDSPIDNKLDSIEFAIAMHLIVCVTKKGLSMPPSLPPSLAMLMNDARGGSGGGTVVVGQSVAAVPPSPGGIPSPDKMGGMMQQQQQPQMMNGGLAQPPPQQMGMAQQPPPAQMGMQQQQQPTIQQSNSFGVSPEGGTVDDAFAGLSNESVNVEEYSVAGDMSAAGGDASGFGGQQAAMSTLGGGVQQQPVMPIQEVATPEPSPMPVKPTMQQIVMPPPPIQQSQQQQQTHALPPRSPRSTPRTTAPTSSEDSSAELVSLREAHQKLQAEVISLRAKAASVSEEEQETQKEIAQLASEIGKLSMELSELKENVMDAKVKLGESVGILKVQLEKKGSLEAQVEEARITHEALTSANTAVEEANEMAMAQRAQSVAAAAMAKEEASVVVPEPAPQQPVETADLFSWGAPAPAAPETNSVAMQPPAQPASVASEISPVLNAAVPPPSDVDRDSFSVYSTSGGVNANPNPYGQPLGAAPPQQQQPMGGGIPEPTNQGFDYNQQQQTQQSGLSPMGPGMSPMGGAGIPEPMGYQQPPSQPQLTPPRQQESFTSYNSAPAPQQAAVPSGPPSPTKAELDEVKGKTVEAEQTYRKQADLVRSISTEVVQLESVAKQAEANMTLLEGKTKKGSFVGGKKKKAKKEYEKAMEIAEAERKKVENAKAQLAAAEKEAQNAKGNVDSLRSKYEEMEMQAATAASYMAAQQQTYGDSQSVVSAQPSMASAQPTVASVQQPAYHDPFGGMSVGQPPAQPTNDLYGAPMGGGGDYANPFL